MTKILGEMFNILGVDRVQSEIVQYEGRTEKALFYIGLPTQGWIEEL